MELRELDLDSDEHADRILLIGTKRSAASIGAILDRRDYNWRIVGSIEEAAKEASEQLYDLLLIDDESNSRPPDEQLELVHAEASLRRLSILLIHPEAEQSQSEEAVAVNHRVQLLASPFEASVLLVKVATLLRLRKIRTEQLNFEARIAEENAELRDLTNRFKSELREARAIQESLLPTVLPSAPGVVFSAYCMPFEAVGGDLYDIWQCSETEFGLFIADVTGHGLTAAFIAAMTKMALSYAKPKSPSAVFEEMNPALHRHMPEGKFVTAACCFYSADTGRLLLARAGHPPALVWRASERKVEILSPKGMPLGILPDCTFELLENRLEPGDKLLLMTDGLTETIDMDGTVLGISGVSEAFAAVAPRAGIVQCIEHLLDEQQRFSGGRLLRDDLTIIGIEREH